MIKQLTVRQLLSDNVLASQWHQSSDYGKLDPILREYVNQVYMPPNDGAGRQSSVWVVLMRMNWK